MAVVVIQDFEATVEEYDQVNEKLGDGTPDGAILHAACDLVLALRDSGAFAGVHLVPVSRYREVAARLEVDLAATGR